MDVRDAAFATGFEYPGGLAALAPRLGMSASELRTKLDPSNAENPITLHESVAIQFLTGDCRILHAMAAELGYTCTPISDTKPAGDE